MPDERALSDHSHHRMRRLSALVPLLAASLLAACGDDDPTSPIGGTEMSVGDQVAIEAALTKVADSLRAVGKTSTDTILADYVRIAARLLRVNGREGKLTVMPMSLAPNLEMRGAVANVVVPASIAIGGRTNTQILVAWEGLDNIALTVRHALVVLVSGTTATGTYTLPSGSAGEGARLLRMSGPFAFYGGNSGTLTVRSSSFGGSCPGIQNTSAQSCAPGRETLAGSLSLTAPGGPATMVSWTDATLPAFRLRTGG